MRRLFSPVLFGLMTAYMYHHNTTETGSVLLLPMIDMVFPQTAGDAQAMGLASVKSMVVITGLIALWEVVDAVRASRKRAKQED